MFFNLVLLIIVLFLTLKNRSNKKQEVLQNSIEMMAKNTDQIVEASKNLNDRMVRVEAIVSTITKGVHDGFRDNRQEIATNLQTIQKTMDTRVRDLQNANCWRNTPGLSWNKI